MDDKRNNPGQQDSGGSMYTSENRDELVNPVNTGSKSENQGNEAATAQTRNPTDSAGAALSTKTNVTGSDFDGQVDR